MSDSLGFNMGNILAKANQPPRTPIEEQSSSRDTGQILADAGIGALRAMAQGRGVLGILAGGALGAIEGDTNEKMRKLQEEHQQLQNDNIRSVMDVRGREMDLAEQKFQAAREQAAQMARGNGTGGAGENPDAMKKRELELARLAEAQLKSDDAVLQSWHDNFDKAMMGTYGADLDLHGQDVLKNSPGYQEARDLYTILKIYDDNPEMAERFLNRMGWVTQEDPDNPGGILLVTGDGRKLPFNAETMKQLQEKIHTNFNNGYMAAMTVGTPASTLQQASMRNILYNDVTKAAYTNDEAALSAYKQMIQDGKYSEREMSTHIMSRTLNAALQDRQLSDEEMAVLVPQFGVMLREFGGEIHMGQDLQTTTIAIRQPDGSIKNISLETFASDLAQRDRIMMDWKNKVNIVLDEKALTDKPNWAPPFPAAPPDMETLRKKWGIRLDGNNITGGGMRVPSGAQATRALSPASERNREEEVKQVIEIGKKFVHDNNLTVSTRSDEQYAAYGAAYSMAQRVIADGGYNVDAMKAFHDAFRIMGFRIPRGKRNDGSYYIPYDDPKLQEQDLKRVNAEIAEAEAAVKNGDPNAQARLKALLEKRKMIEFWGNVEVTVTRAPMSSEPPFMRYGGGVLGLGENGISNGVRNIHNNNEQPHYSPRMVRLSELQNAPQLSQNPLLQGGELRLQPHRQSDAQISAPRPRVRRKSK